MSFQYPEHRVPQSFSPAPNVYPARLVMRETADIPAALSSEERERAARRIARRVLDVFWVDMGMAHFSAAMQICPTHPLYDKYKRSAEDNRLRIAADLAISKAI